MALNHLRLFGLYLVASSAFFFILNFTSSNNGGSILWLNILSLPSLVIAATISNGFLLPSGGFSGSSFIMSTILIATAVPLVTGLLLYRTKSGR